MLKPIRNFQRTFYSVHISHQHALLRTLQNQPSSEQTTTSNNNKNEHPQLHNEIHKAQINLGESNIPLATSVMGMQELIDSPHFQTMVVKQSKFVRAFWKSKHPLVDVAKNVMTNVAPKTLDGENAEKHPVPLPFRGIIVAMVGSIFKPGDKKVLSIAEINGLISAGMNIHRNILPRIPSTGLKQENQVLTTANKLAVLVGDVLLAKANELTAELENPRAAAKISDMLSEISQISVKTQDISSQNTNNQNCTQDIDHSTVLWRECCETVVLVAGGEQVEYQIIGDFIENVGKSYVCLVENDHKSSFERKVRALECLDELEVFRHQVAEKKSINLLRGLTKAFLPIDWVEPVTVKV